MAASVLSNRYITNRFLPDKAIDLIDEACAGIKVEIASMPAELDELNRRIRSLEVEKVALKKESDESSKRRLFDLEEELSKAKEESDKMTKEWEEERADIAQSKSIKGQIEEENIKLQDAFLRGDYQLASKIQYKDIPDLKKTLADIEEKHKGKERLVDEVVDEESIARIVSKATGIPANKIAKGDREKVLFLKKTLAERVIGQDEAITLVSNAILRQRAGIQNPNRPIGSFLFLGPTGVGKTEVAKALAEDLFDDENAIIRIDMSEYMERYSVSRLIGAAPGYVGYEEGGQLTEKVRRRPYSIVLFDEIEKANPEVFNLLLQILDDGRLTDSQGHLVDFKNTIIIMTSNLGSSALLEGVGPDGEITQEAKDEVTALLHRTFRPEFLNRLDEIVFYRPLTRDNMGRIIDLLTASLAQRMAEKELHLEITDAAKDYIISHSYDPAFGARPLKRYLQSHVETLIARTILAGELVAGETVVVNVKNGELNVEEK